MDAKEHEFVYSSLLVVAMWVRLPSLPVCVTLFNCENPAHDIA
jgi:hypothetical protein